MYITYFVSGSFVLSDWPLLYLQFTSDFTNGVILLQLVLVLDFGTIKGASNGVCS